jgi:hypothetical protein
MKVTKTELQITLCAQSSPHRSEALAKFRPPDIGPGIP